MIEKPIILTCLVLCMFVSNAACWQPVLLDDIEQYRYNEEPYANPAAGREYHPIFMQEAHHRDEEYENKYKLTKAYKRPEHCRSILHDTYQIKSNYTQQIQEHAKITYRVCKKLAEMHKVPYEKLYERIGTVYVPKEMCPFAQQTYKCDQHSKYREYDGSCNNLKRPWVGKKDTLLKRLQVPRYHDSMGERRSKSMTKKDLPNPRTISHHLTNAVDHKIKLNVISVFYSQFIDHDMSLTALVAAKDGKPKPCACNTDDPDCLNIPTPSDVKEDQDQKCMVSPRSLGVHARMDCKLGPREQMNALTHWLDMSQMYGVSKEDNLKLRTLKDGLMKVSFINGIKYEHLPFDKIGEGKCKNTDGLACFMGPEIRMNQNLPLLGVHTIYLREHNRIARRLKSINPHLDDHELYEMTRRINIACYQHIIYNDWLPIIIGRKMATIYDAISKKSDYYYGYNPEITPHIYNEFATSAFRFGHTLVYSWLAKYDMGMKVMTNISLETSMLKTSEAYREGGLDGIIRGTIYEPATAYDNHVTDALNIKLFVNPDKNAETHHFSLPALNCNRDRDHGIASYNTYRKMCGLKAASTFKDFDNMPERVRNKLAQIYGHVEDVELFIGGISEHPVEDGVVGPTFASIIAQQFKLLRQGDRHYYECGHDKNLRFELHQLNEIRKATVSRLLCDNMDLEYIPKNPWFVISKENPAVKCSTIPSINLDVFRVKK